MKTSLLPVSQPQNNHELESMIEFEHEKIKKTAYANGKNNGMKDIPLPLAKGDKLIHFIQGIKGSYEQLAFKVLQQIQPASHLPEGRIEADWSEIHNKRLVEDIAKIQKKINLFKSELGDRDPSDLLSKIRKANLICIGLFIGEVIINTGAFQVMGDNLLFCFLLSASVAFAVSLGAHIAGRKYKDAKTKRERNIVIIISAIGISILSGVIASLRSIFLKKIGVDINPLYLTVFNIVFFLIAAIATWYLHPSKEEMDQNEEALKLHTKIQKLKAEKKRKEDEQVEHEKTTKDKLKHNLRSLVYGEYTIERVRRLYKESVGEFKSANLLCRHDVPDCFGDQIPELDIPHITFKSTINKFKHDENDFNNSAS